MNLLSKLGVKFSRSWCKQKLILVEIKSSYERAETAAACCSKSVYRKICFEKTKSQKLKESDRLRDNSMSYIKRQVHFGVHMFLLVSLSFAFFTSLCYSSLCCFTFWPFNSYGIKLLNLDLPKGKFQTRRHICVIIIFCLSKKTFGYHFEEHVLCIPRRQFERETWHWKFSKLASVDGVKKNWWYALPFMQEGNTRYCNNCIVRDATGFNSST